MTHDATLKVGAFQLQATKSYLDPALRLTIFGLICLGLFVLIYGLNNGINDYYGFRQSQTALTAYWLNKEPHGFAYLTPVLGAPWSVPFEFPIYQWIVVLLTKVGVPLVPAGRIVSFAAFIGCLAPLKMMARDFRITDRAFLITAVLFVASPLYIYWARTPMIETTALLFSLCWLAGFIRSRNEHTVILWIFTVCFGVLAGLTKSTTFIGFGPIIGMLFLYDVAAWLRGDKSGQGLVHLVALALQALIPLTICSAWIVAAEHFKSGSPFGLFLSSQSLTTFIFGTIAQRLAIAAPILNSLKETFGRVGYFIPMLIALDLLTNKYRVVIVACAAAFLMPFFILTNLHTVHAYYQVANAVFIIVAVGLSITALLEKGWYISAGLAMFCILSSQGFFFREYFWPPVLYDSMHGPVIVAAKAARDKTSPDESVLVFGEDWSSAVPFYSERRSLAFPSNPVVEPLLKQVLANPQAFLGTAKLGAIVDCRVKSATPYRPEVDKLITAFMEGKTVLFQSDNCKVTSP
jgi:hypothetical protein